MRQGSDDITGR